MTKKVKKDDTQPSTKQKLNAKKLPACETDFVNNKKHLWTCAGKKLKEGDDLECVCIRDLSELPMKYTGCKVVSNNGGSFYGNKQCQFTPGTKTRINCKGTVGKKCEMKIALKGPYVDPTSTPGNAPSRGPNPIRNWMITLFIGGLVLIAIVYYFKKYKV